MYLKGLDKSLWIVALICEVSMVDDKSTRRIPLQLEEVYLYILVGLIL